jgi:hypothetical protein
MTFNQLNNLGNMSFDGSTRPAWTKIGSKVDLWIEKGLYWALKRRYPVDTLPGLDGYAFTSFEATSIKGLATVTRAGVGTVVQDGSIVSVAAGMPRVGTELVTNLLTYSAEFDNAAWTKSASGAGSAPVVTANAGTAPDGSETADRVDFDRGGSGGTDWSLLGQAPTTSAGDYAGTFYIKAWAAGDVGKFVTFRHVAAAGFSEYELTAEWQRIEKVETRGANGFDIGCRGVTNGGSESFSCLLWGAQLVTGSEAKPYIPTTSAAVTASVGTGILVEEARTNLLLNSATLSTQNVTTTATAYTLSFKSTGTVTLTGTSTAGPLVGTGASDIVELTFTPTAGTLTLTVSGTVEEANLEAGSFRTSWAPTAGASVTRPADSVTIATSDIPGFVSSDIFVYAEFDVPAGLSTQAGVIAFDDGTGNNRVNMRLAPGAQGGQLLVVSGAAAQANIIDNTAISGTVRMAARFKANDFKMWRDGASIGTPDTSGTMPSGMTVLRLSSEFFGGRLNAPLRTAYVFTDISDANAVGLTAGTIDPASLSPVLSLDFVNRTYSRGGDPFAETVLSDDFSGYGSTAEMQTVWADISTGTGTVALDAASIQLTGDGTTTNQGRAEATISGFQIGEAYEVYVPLTVTTGWGRHEFGTASGYGVGPVNPSANFTGSTNIKYTIAATQETYYFRMASGVAGGASDVNFDNITIKRVEAYLTGVDSTHGLSATETFNLVYDDATTGTQAAVGGKLTLVATNNPLARVYA